MVLTRNLPVAEPRLQRYDEFRKRFEFGILFIHDSDDSSAGDRIFFQIRSAYSLPRDGCWLTSGHGLFRNFSISAYIGNLLQLHVRVRPHVRNDGKMRRDGQTPSPECQSTILGL